MKVDIYNTENKYDVIYIDPPWNIKLISRKLRPNQLDIPYKTMTLDEIKNLPIKNLANENGCHLFLWTTHRFLPKAFEVIESWGFKYNCTITWDKTYGFTPYSFMWSTEFCLYCQIPNKWVKQKKMGEKTLIQEKPTKHSKKPEKMYELIEKITEGKKIELFARNTRDDWDCFGDEI